jgi:hypothetical protein
MGMRPPSGMLSIHWFDGGGYIFCSRCSISGSMRCTHFFPFFDGLPGPEEFQQSDVRKLGREQYVRRVSGQTAAGDALLGDVHGAGNGVEKSRRFVFLSGKGKEGARVLLDQIRERFGHAVLLFLSLGGLTRCLPTMSPLRFTAMTTSAPRARQTETGTGLTRPPSTSQRFSCRMAGKRPGREMDAHTASSNGPLVNHISRPDSRSVATDPYCSSNPRCGRLPRPRAFQEICAAWRCSRIR